MKKDTIGFSPLLVRTVKAFHRAEIDSFAEMAEALGVCSAKDWPRVSKWAGKRFSSDVATRLWIWGKKKWGVEMFSAAEYNLREEKD